MCTGVHGTPVLIVSMSVRLCPHLCASYTPQVLEPAVHQILVWTGVQR